MTHPFQGKVHFAVGFPIAGAKEGELAFYIRPDTNNYRHDNLTTFAAGAAHATIRAMIEGTQVPTVLQIAPNGKMTPYTLWDKDSRNEYDLEVLRANSTYMLASKAAQSFTPMSLDNAVEAKLAVEQQRIRSRMLSRVATQLTP